MEFKKTIERSSFLNPSTGKVEELEIEIRFDPITGKRSRILTKPLPFPKNPELPDFTKEWCPFCDDKIEDIGARDTRIAKGELLKRNEAILMANISPYAEISLVIRISKAHYIPINEFQPYHFFDGLMLALDYIRKTDFDFSTITMNYLKPAGSSISHPHIQVMLSRSLFDYQERLVQGAEKYYKDGGKCFWDDFWDEFEDNRVSSGRWRLFTPFAPRGFEHVQGYIKKGLTDIEEEDLMEISDCIVRILKAYNEAGFNSFNFGMFAPLRKKEHLPIVFDIVARTPMDKYYQNDTFAIAKLYDESYTNKKPEDTAKEIRNYF